MSAYIPPGWPAGVHPPGSEEFESTAVGWLLDVVPPDYRLHGVLRRYPIALAVMARHHSMACVEGAREGYRTARTELAGVLPPHAVDTVLAAYRKEGARLAGTARAVDLVERALRGEVFTPKMGQAAAAAAGPEDKEATGAEPMAAAPRPAGRRSAGGKAEQKADEAKAEQKSGGGKAEQKSGGAKAPGKKAAGADGTGAERGRAGAERGRAGARRNSASQGRNDLART